MTVRQPVPEAVKRQLRQEAGFGCCNCGHPFIEYHHIIPFAADPHFRPEDMMVLCSNCHHLCTTGAMPEAEQRAKKARPKNIVEDALRGQLFVTATDLRVELAGGMAINTPSLLRISGTEVLGARRSEDGRVLMYAVICDSEGRIVAWLIDNEWVVSPSQVWDFDLKPRVATVRSAPGHISFSVDCRDDRVRLEGTWYSDGHPIYFGPTEAKVGGITLRGNIVENSPTYINVGR